MILDAKITLYAGYEDKVGRPATMRDFINLCAANRDAVEQLRAEGDPERRKQIKKQLPAATLSGVFSPSRKTDHLQQHSGYICVDIDHIEDTAGVMDALWNLDIVAYVSRSVSGSGVFAVIPLAYPERHKEQFRALEKYFADELGIILDAACKDVTRLRTISYDSSARLRTTAVAYRGLPAPEPERRLQQPSTTACWNGAGGSANRADYTLQDVETCVNKIIAQRLDITIGYENWMQIGMALAAGLGETGRQYFHCVSQFHWKYSRKESDDKFTEWLANTRSYTIKTFFWHCEKNGIYSISGK